MNKLTICVILIGRLNYKKGVDNSNGDNGRNFITNKMIHYRYQKLFRQPPTQPHSSQNRKLHFELM